MDTFLYLYVAAWGTACLAAVVMALRDRSSYVIFHADYFRFIGQRWKWVTFAVALAGLTLIAPYTGDPTWDYVDAPLQSVLTFITAPWVVGILYQTMRRKVPLRQTYVAVCTWLFSASWVYDLYILCRDGSYPPTWSVNIVLSSVLYISAGLMWNLDYREGTGAVLAFKEDDWPAAPRRPVFHKIFWFAAPFIVVAAVLASVFLF